MQKQDTQMIAKSGIVNKSVYTSRENARTRTTRTRNPRPERTTSKRIRKLTNATTCNYTATPTATNLVINPATSTTKGKAAMPKNNKLKFVERARPEAYSCTVALRVRPSEKKSIQEYAAANGVNLDTVLRSALVAAGILAA